MNLRSLLVTLLWCFAIGVPLSSAQAALIESFTAEITVHPDATFTVREDIEYILDPEDENRHGIFRVIPRTVDEKASEWFKERYINVVVNQVLLDDGAVPFTVDTTRDQVRVTIGDPQQTISGTHRYTIEYTVSGGIAYYSYGGADLYWNVTGDAWSMPIRRMEARVSSSDGLLLRERSCYRGPEGLSGSCEPIITEGDTVIFRARDMYPSEGVTIAQSLDRMRIPEVIFERYVPAFLWTPIVVILVAFGLYRAFEYYTAHRTGRPIIVQYEPYPNLKPMYTGVLMDGKLDARDITACIVYLAERGYLKIIKTNRKVLMLFEVDDFEIELVKNPDHEVSVFEERVLELLFGISFTLPARISLYERAHNIGAQRSYAEQLNALRSDLGTDLIRSGFYEKLSARKVLTLGGYILALGVGVAFLNPESVPLVVVLVPLAIVVLLLIHARRTQKGYEVLDHLKGFKQFLEVTEKDRYWFHNAPEKNSEQFLQYLPYAIAFGVEDSWASAFKDALIPNPPWYVGDQPSSFSVSSLSASIGSFVAMSTHATNAALTAASHGGGFAGGGRGGGGGGSW